MFGGAVQTSAAVMGACALALALGTTGCDENAGPDGDGASEGASAGDEGGDDDVYVVRGRIDGGASASQASSPAAARLAWSDDPRTRKDPSDPGTDPGKGPGDPYAWQCVDDPTWAPCSSCEPGFTQTDCDDAITSHCDGVYDDPLCPWICETDPGYGPCDQCQWDDPPEVCEDAWNDWCANNPSEPYCGGNEGGEEDTPPDLMLTPSALWLKVYKVQFSQDPIGCTDPITIADVAEPEYVNLGDNPQIFSVGAPPDGEYPCVIITFSDHIRWSAAQVAACGGDHVQDVYYAPGEDSDNEEIVTMYISTAGDPTGESSAWEAPGLKLEAPHVAGPDVLASTLVVYADNRVGYWENPPEWRDACELGAPTFGYETTYR